MTREEILNMLAGREMDALIAEKLFGLVENPNNTAPTSETWFWVHPKDGVLIGIPFDIGGKIENTEIYDHQWERFCPSTDIADAWTVAEEMMKREYQTKAKFVFGVTNSLIMLDRKDACLSICRAALLAVMEAE